MTDSKKPSTYAGLIRKFGVYEVGKMGKRLGESYLHNWPEHALEDYEIMLESEAIEREKPVVAREKEFEKVGCEYEKAVKQCAKKTWREIKQAKVRPDLGQQYIDRLISREAKQITPLMEQQNIALYHWRVAKARRAKTDQVLRKVIPYPGPTMPRITVLKMIRAMHGIGKDTITEPYLGFSGFYFSENKRVDKKDRKRMIESDIKMTMGL